MDIFEELGRLLQEAGLKVTFGLTEEKRARVTQLLAEGHDWPYIGREVGWDPTTLRQFYEEEWYSGGDSNP